MHWTDLKWTTKPKQDRISDWNDKTDSWRSELNKLRAEIAEATAQETDLQSYSWIWVDEKPNCRWNHRSDAKPVCEMGNSRLNCYRLWQELRLMQLNSSNFNSANERRLNIPYLYHITTKVKEKLNPLWRLLKLCWGNLRNQNYVRMKHFLASTTHLGMTTSTTQRFPKRRTRTEIHMKYCCHRRLQKNMIAEKTKKKQKSQAYYDQTAKDLTELTEAWRYR